MNKQIIFSLLLITTATINGMKRPNNFQGSDITNAEMVLYDSDILQQITPYLCMSHDYRPCEIRKDIRALYETSKFLHHYYGQEKNQQDIIRSCSHYHGSNDKDVARNLKCCTVLAKIKRYTDIAHNKNQQFNENDLKEPWYLNMTTAFWCKFLRRSVQQSLLQIALNHSDTTKAIQIIDHAKQLDFYYSYNYGKNLLSDITRIRNQNQNFDINQDCITDDEYNDLLEIAKRLLQKNILPDGREKIEHFTPLMDAVKYNDKELARLLLEYGADPYAEYYDIFAKKRTNTFDLEEGKSWLQKMINEVAENKNNQDKK